MRKFSPEIDDLMWTVAESGDPAAVDEFCVRHPESADEARKRFTMVANLKGSRPKSARRSSPERFMPSARQVGPGVPRWGYVAATALVLAGIVVATVGTVRYLDTKAKLAGQEGSGGTMQGFEQPTVIVPAGGQPTQQDRPGGQPTAETGGAPAPEVVLPFDRLVTIVSKNASLSACLNDIALQAGIKLESAPGMPELNIELDYRETPAIAVLQDMGRVFGFSVMRQDASTALLIPAVDPTKRNDQPPTSGSSGPVNPNPPAGAGLQPVGGQGPEADRSGN